MPSKRKKTVSSLKFHSHIKSQQGMTLVEIMVVVALLALLILFAAPDIQTWRPSLNMKSQSELFFSNMHRAKTHALKNNVDVVFVITPGAPCPGGNYSLNELISGNVVSAGTMIDGVCLSGSDFAAGDGFTARGLPINGVARTVTITHSKVAGVQYQIVQSVAGGITIDKL